MNEEEMWAEIRDFPSHLISSYGRVANWERNILINPRLSGWGYLQVVLYKDGRHVTKTVHRLVAEAFVAGEDRNQEVNHIDGDKLNNNDYNLEWVTKRYNNQHAYDTGLRQGRGRAVEILETGERFRSIQDCATAVGMTLQGVRYSIKNETTTRKGLSFRYAT